jgi:hypothetical protein
MCLQCNEDLEKLSDDEIAFALRLDQEETNKTKTVLTGKGFLVNGWEIRAWDKRQYKSDISTQRTRTHREKMKKSKGTAGNKDGNSVEQFRERSGTVPGTPPDSDTDSDPEDSKSLVHSPDGEKPKSEYEAKTAESFEVNFWANWPKKKNKKGALKAFRAVFPRKQSQATKMRRWQNFKLHLAKSLAEMQTREAEFIPYGASWLNAQDFDHPPEADEDTTLIEWEEAHDGG